MGYHRLLANLKFAPRSDTSTWTPHALSQMVEICWVDIHTDSFGLVNFHDTKQNGTPAQRCHIQKGHDMVTEHMNKLLQAR